MATNASRRGGPVPHGGRGRRGAHSPAVAFAAAVAGVTALAGLWAGLKLSLLGVRRAFRLARFVFLVATLSLYRGCPDCRKMIHSRARVCHHCGYRLSPG